MLLPPDVREFVPEGHLARFVVSVVESMDTADFHAHHPNDRAGRPAYNPDVLLALCLYGACLGVSSARRLEALCEVDLAFRYITANATPDHSTISRFLERNEGSFKATFLETLRLCAAEGMVKVGVVALDGTKVAASASLAANARRDALEAEVDAIVEGMIATNRAEDERYGDARGDELPESLRDPKRLKERLERLNKALGSLDEAAAADRARAAERAERLKERARQRRGSGRQPQSGTLLAVAHAEAGVEAAKARAAAKAEARAATEAKAATAGRRPGGRTPDLEREVREAEERLAEERAAWAATEEEERASARVNTTDPDSRIMKTRSGWVQGYNAQAVVTADQVIVAAAVTDQGNDVEQFVPMTEETATNLVAVGVDEEIGIVLADAGYFSDDNATAEGPDRLIATAKSWTLAQKEPTAGEPPDDASPKAAMEHRLCTEEGRALYKLRSQTVEPVFGQIKEARRLRRFRRRGLAAVGAEWNMACAAHNLLKLFRARQRAPASA